MDYYRKYLKYKSKYLNKNQTGGDKKKPLLIHSKSGGIAGNITNYYFYDNYVYLYNKTPWEQTKETLKYKTNNLSPIYYFINNFDKLKPKITNKDNISDGYTTNITVGNKIITLGHFDNKYLELNTAINNIFELIDRSKN